MKLHSELKMLQKKWKRSKARNIMEPIPDGKKEAKIVDCRLEKSKSSSRLQVAWIMQIISGKYKDRMVYRYSGLETEDNISFLKADLKKLGIKIPKNIARLERALDAAIGKECKITIKTRGEFTNVWIDELLDDNYDDYDGEESEE